MKSSTTDFADLISRVREGSEEAAWELIAQYGDLVFRVVRRRLPERLRPAFDSADFVQVAWKSIFRHRSRLDRFGKPEEFIAFLAAVATNKVHMEIRRRFHQQKNNVNRECPFGMALNEPDPKQPTPSRVAMAREKWFELIEKLPPRHKEVIRLRYVGYSNRQIASEVGFDEGHVRRIVRNVLERVT